MLDTITIIIIFFCNKKLSGYSCAGFSVHHEYPELLLEQEFAGSGSEAFNTIHSSVRGIYQLHEE